LPFEDKITAKLYEKIKAADYSMAPNFSDNLKDFISRILVVDPNRRYKIEDIRRHPWYNMVPPFEKQGIIIGKNEIPIDEKIFDKTTSEYKIPPENLRTDLKRNKFNQSTTAYYLLYKRLERSEIYKK